MTPPPGGSKNFSTSAPRPWQYTNGTALHIAGPRLATTSERTRVGMNVGTSKATLPIALRFQGPPKISLPDLRNYQPAQQQLAEQVAGVLPAHQQKSPMSSEADVIRKAGPFFTEVAEILAPHFLAQFGYHGVLRWDSKVNMGGSEPDLVLTYNGRNALVIDYKGPNCIRQRALERMSAKNMNDAMSKLPKKIRTLLDASLTARDDRALVQQGVKYAENTAAPYVIFYDYEHLFALEPTVQLVRETQPVANVMLDVCLVKEDRNRKSTESQLVALEENHVSTLLKYIVMAVSKVA